MITRSIRRAATACLATAALIAGSCVVVLPAAAASPKPHHVSAAAHHVNVRTLAAAEAAPGFVTPKRTVPALQPGPKLTVRHGAAAATFPAPIGRTPKVVAWPGFGQKTGFGGLADSATSSSTQPVIEPPDPWVAAGPNHVVQVVNTTIRMSSRQGSELWQVSLASFFLESGDLIDADSRILYDAAEGRWLGIELSADCSTGHLRLAVSDGVDPTLGWTVWDFQFPGALMDFPGLGYSSDKVAFSANTYPLSGCSIGSFQGGNLFAFDWADLIAGGSLTGSSWSTPNQAHWRPATGLTYDDTLHAVAEDATGDVIEGDVTGTNAGADIALSSTDLTAGGPAIPGFALPLAPKDPGGTIADATDGRPTDAIWRAGRLYFVSTFPYDNGITTADTVRVTEVDTAGMTVPQDVLFGDPGYDAYLGGIGLSQIGGLYVVYTESNASTPASILAAYQSPFAAPYTASVVLQRSGLSGYKGTRWGDFVGVATDPVDPYGVWQADEYANAAGSWSTWVSTLTEDRTPPNTTVPVVRLVSPTTAGTSTAPATVSWSSSDDFTGVVQQELQVSINAGAWTPVALASPTSTSASQNLTLGSTYRYRARATDAAGNVGAWAFTATQTLAVASETSTSLHYGGSWTLASVTGAVGGKVKYASAGGAYVYLTFTGQQVTWVAVESSASGSAKVYVDGVYKTTVSLYRSTTALRQVVYSFSWSSVGTHTIKLVVSGTSGHPRVYLDAFEVLH